MSVPWAEREGAVDVGAYGAYLKFHGEAAVPAEPVGYLTAGQLKRFDALAREVVSGGVDGMCGRYKWLGCSVANVLLDSWGDYWRSTEGESDARAEAKFLVWCYTRGGDELHVIVPTDAKWSTVPQTIAACHALAELVGCVEHENNVVAWVCTGDVPAWELTPEGEAL